MHIKDRNTKASQNITRHMDDEERAQLEASWVALQRKSKQYNELQGQDVQQDDVLVDFLYKQEESSQPSFLQSENQWVEIVDEFGRTRLVRREDVPEVPVVSQEPNDSVPSSHGMMSTDMMRERERQEWEEAVQSEQLNKHFDSKWERRTLGVGYYQLSQDMDARRQQMEELRSLRNDTLLSRTRAQKVKEERHRKLEQRRRILEERARKRRHGLDPSKQKANEFLQSLIE
jgi:hypothetical protein